MPSTPAQLANPSIVGGYVNATNDTPTQILTGSADPGNTITVYDNGTQIGTAIADATTGAWSYTLGVLSDAAHSLTATATDAASVVSAASAPLNFTVDTSVPAVPTALADAAIANGYVNAAADTAAQALTGTAEAGSTVALYDAGIQIGTATADATTGAWSYTLGALADGAHSLTATATDAAGNVGPASTALAFTVDTSVPAAPTALADAAIANGYVNAAADIATQALTGTAEAGSTVLVADNGTTLGTVTADATTGAWSYTLGALADGAHSLTAAATDAAGNVGPVSAALAFTVDTSVPAAPAALADAAIANGYVNAAADTAAQALTGTAEAGSTVLVADNGTTLGTVTADATTGAWSYTLGALAEGAHSLTAAATDAAGNVGPVSTALAFTVDTSVPAAPTALADAAIANGYVNAAADTAAQALTGTAEAGSTVAVYDAGIQIGTATADATTGAWSYTLGALAEGAHSLTATATDAAGNVGPVSAALAFTVDTSVPAAPTALADAAIANGYVNAAADTAAQALTGTAEAGSTVLVADNGTTLGTVTADATTGAWSYTLGALADGAHSLTATATDAAGNVGPASTALAFTVDTSVPAAPAALADAAIANGYVNAAADTAAQALTGTAEAGSTVLVADNGTTLGTVTADATTGAWSYTLGALAEGAHSLTATATDAAGNVGPVSAALTFTVDTTAPTLTVSGPSGNVEATSAAGAAVAFSASATDTVDGTDVVGFSENGQAVSSGDVFGFGAHTVTATTTDAAGNLSSSDIVFSVVDNTPPSAPTIGSSGSALTAIADQTIAGTGEAGSRIQLFDGMQALGEPTLVNGDGTWQAQLSLPDGTHQITAVDIDLSGNASNASGPVTYTIDTVAPAAPVIDALGRLTNVVDQAISGTGEAGSTVQLFDSGDQVGGAALVDESGHWSTNLRFTDGTHSLTAVDTDAAGNASTTSSAVGLTVLPNVDPVSSAVLPMIDPDVHGGFQITNTSLGLTGGNMGDSYTGPLGYLHSQLIWTGTQGIAVSATTANVFLHGGSGDDALQVTFGNNVLDGGAGSNFMVGAQGMDGGADTFFVDARASAPTWSTIVNFHAGDKVAIWGFADGTSNAAWVGQDGVSGFTGATLRAQVNGHDAAVTVSGMSNADAAGLSFTTGTVEGQNYLLITTRT